jgi:hypothetical protein
MSYLIGISGALGVALIGTVGRFDRDRGFYPTLLMVIASYYLLFAAIGGSVSALWTEAGILAVFVVIAMWCIRSSLWIVVAGLTAHGVFDWFHAALPVDAGAPNWWPTFCLAFDITAAAYVACLITSGRIPSRSPVAV